MEGDLDYPNYQQNRKLQTSNGWQKVFGRLLIYFNLIATFFSGALAVGKYAWDASKFQCHRNEQRKWRFEILRLVHSKVVSITTLVNPFIRVMQLSFYQTIQPRLYTKWNFPFQTEGLWCCLYWFERGWPRRNSNHSRSGHASILHARCGRTRHQRGKNAIHSNFTCFGLIC